MSPVKKKMHRTDESSRILITVVAVWLAAPTLGWAQAATTGEGADGFRVRMEKWVQARAILSKERSDWQVDKQFLESARGMLLHERDVLREEIEALELAQSGADQERRELVQERVELREASGSLSTKIADLEAQVLRLIPNLPEPLQRRLDPLLVQIPTNPENTRVALGQRLMNVLGVLAQAEKWNGTANFVGETRAVTDGGEKVLVRTLYWGLAQAVFVDAQGETAGLGRPTYEGWIFEDVDGLADEAKLLLDIYEGNVDTIAFVPVPVEVR
ncbi:MAG: DUF3450 family protein [Deltaproteobacteria bacterium]|jgi:hypothetical protein|nr:DUF3450 family protein [Deltaproteobacteria bacterium]